MTATGIWWDAYLPRSAYVHPTARFYWLGKPPRVLDAGQYFRLIGHRHDQDAAPQGDPAGATFAIGTSVSHIAERRGRQYAFANDHPDAYWNNWDGVTLGVDVI